MAIAQSEKFEVGFAGGPSYSRVSGEAFNRSEPAFHLKFMGALNVQVNLNKFLSVYTAVGLERKGDAGKEYTTDINGNNMGPSTVVLNSEFLILPVLFRYYLNDRRTFFANIGPYVGYLLRQQYRRDPFSYFVGLNTYGFENRFDSGLTGGVGFYKSLTNNLYITGELRSSFSLHYLVNENGYAARFKHVTVSPVLGLNYALGK